MVKTKDIEWKKVSELKAGDILCTNKGYDKIVSIGDVPECEVYDIEVECEESGIYANDIVVGDYSMNNSFKMRTNNFLVKNPGSNDDMLVDMMKKLEDLNR